MPRPIEPSHLFATFESAEMDEAYDQERPGLFALFAELAEQVRDSMVRRGRVPRYSADAIGHRIRWHYQVEKGDDEFKFNNDHTSYLARRLMRVKPATFNPEGGVPFFETRARPIRQGQMV